MKGPMKLLNHRTGLMECRICRSCHHASLQSGYERTDGITRFRRGSWQCTNDNCASNQKEWDAAKQRYVKTDWRKFLAAV